MTSTDERRAALLLRYSEFVVQTEEQFLELARAIRESDEAAGMVLVPKEATEKMAREGARAFRDFYSEAAPYPRAKSVYRAMIAVTEAE